MFNIKEHKLLLGCLTGSLLAAGYIILRYQRIISYRSKFKLIPSAVHVVCSSEQWNSIYPTITKDLRVCKLLGFDCEWTSSSDQKRPVALLQLATPHGTCVLLRMLQMDHIPSTLRDLMADKLVIKAGVGCLGDAQKLLKDHSLLVQGCVDLRHLAVRARISNANGLGLKALAEDLLGIDLDKDISIRAGNWEQPILSSDQVTYAALDALVGAKIFLVLVNRKLGRGQQCQDEPITDEEAWTKVQSMCQGIIDIKFGQNLGGDGYPKSSHSRAHPKSWSQATRAYKLREKPLYHNCQLWAPDGQMLCTCDLQKAQWYLDKGLGEKVQDDPLVVRLTFEPSGRPVNEMNYYLKVKDNQCVVCGKKDSYIRKNVVPREYRKYFPTLLKEHRSHDVVLLCSECHRLSGLYDVSLKDHLIAQCGIGKDTIKFKSESSLQKVKSAAKALLNTKANIPESRKEELRNIIRLYYGINDLTEEVLKQAVDMDVRLPNDDYIPHGQLVVQYYIEHDGLMALEKLWRQHFLDTMQPRYLPELWSVDHSHDELKGMDTALKDAIHL